MDKVCANEDCGHLESAHHYKYYKDGEQFSDECINCDCHWGEYNVNTASESYTLDEWTVAEAVVEHGDRVLLYGPPGTGKTHLARFHGLNGRGCNMITMTEETPAESLIGHHVTDGPMVLSWMDNPGIDAWRYGKRLTINEIDKACGDALDVSYVLCDSNNIAALTLPNASRETVAPADGYQVVATMNGLPEALPEALQDRFAVQIKITTPHPQALASLPLDLQEIARKTVVVQDPARRIGIRKWKAYSQLRGHVENDIASQACFGQGWRSLMGQIEAFADRDQQYRDSYK